MSTPQLEALLAFARDGDTVIVQSMDQLAQAVRQSALRVPLELLLVETDAPYLAPIPHRGKRHVTAYTRLVAEHLANLRGLPYSELADLTTANGRRVFPRLVG